MAKKEGYETSSYVMLIGIREKPMHGYQLASVKDADRIMKTTEWNRTICGELTKRYTRCASLRNGYLRHYHRDGIDNMVTLQKYRPNLQYKLVYKDNGAKDLEEENEAVDGSSDDDDEEEEEEEQNEENEKAKAKEENEEKVKAEKECLLRFCHIFESGNEMERRELCKKLKSKKKLELSELSLLGEISRLAGFKWTLHFAHDNHLTVLHLLVERKCVRALEALLKVPDGLMVPESRQHDDDDEDELLRRELSDLLSGQDRWGDTALHCLSSWLSYSREEAYEVTRFFTKFCRQAIDVKEEKDVGVTSNIPFINRLLSIRSLYQDGLTVLAMLLRRVKKSEKEKSMWDEVERQNQRGRLDGFLDAMQQELMRQGEQLRGLKSGAEEQADDNEEEEEEEGLDVSWLLTTDENENGRTAFHYKFKRVVQIVPPKHLRPHNLFKLCTAKDSLNGSTPLHGLRSDRESDAQFCSALSLLSKQVQALDDERRRRRRSRLQKRSRSSAPTNIAVNIVSSDKTSGSSSIWKDGAAVDAMAATAAAAAFDGSHQLLQQSTSTNISTSSSTRRTHPSFHQLPRATVDNDFLHALVHAKDDDGRTPLHTAQGSQCIDALLRFGASVAEPDSDGNDVLTAAFEGLFSKEVMTSISTSVGRKREGDGNLELKKGEGEGEGGLASVRHNTCDSLLQWACPLHEAEADVGAQIQEVGLGSVPTWVINKRIGRLGVTALHVAAGIGSSTRVEKLLQKGAHVNIRCSGGRTPLHMATSQRLSRLVVALRDSHCSPLVVIEHLTFCDRYDNNEVEQKPQRSNELLMKQMKSNLKVGLKLGRPNEEAFWKELRTKMREYLDTQDFSGQTCVHNLVGNFAAAAAGGEGKDVSRILKHCIQRVGCRVDLGNRVGDTLLHVAVANCEDSKMVEDIIRWAESSFSEMEADGSSSSEKKEEMISRSDWLLMGNASEETALHVAVRMRRMDMVKVLLSTAAMEMEVEVMEEMLWRRKDVLKMTAIDCIEKAITTTCAGRCGAGKSKDMDMAMLVGWINDNCCCCWQHLKAAATDLRQHRNKMDRLPEYKHNKYRRRLPLPCSNPAPPSLSPPAPPHAYGLSTTPLRLVDKHPRYHQDDDDDDPWLDLQRKLSDQPTFTDELDRSWLVKGIVELLLNPQTSTPITIGILGNWGSGKTSFMHQVDASLLVLNTPEKERIEALDGAVDISPKYYSIYKAKAFLTGIRKQSDAPEKRLSIVTVWYNAWQYDGKTEAAAGLALEVSKELEGLMTLCQWLRMCCKYGPTMNRMGFLTSLILPTLLAIGLIILALTLVKVLHVPLTYGASMGALGVIGVLFKSVKTIVPPVSKAMTTYMSTPDHSVMLGYKHRVIKDIQFLQEQLCTRAQFPFKVVDLLWGYVSRGQYMKETSIRKECPNKNNLRIIVFMDDIDRCDEKIVLELLREINLVAMACGISVVLGANEQIIHGAILRELTRTERTCQCIAKAAQVIQSKSDGIVDISSESSQDDDLAERFMQKIIQIPVRLVEPRDEDLWKFVQRVSTNANGNWKTTEDSGDAKGETSNVSSSVENANAIKNEVSRKADSKGSRDAEVVTTKDSSAGVAGNANARKIEVSIKLDSNDPRDVKKKTIKETCGATSGKDNSSMIELSIKIDPNGKKETTKDTSGATSGNANGAKNGAGSSKLYGRAPAGDGIALNTTAELNILSDLIPLTHGDQRLPREWKRFMNYHQLARRVISAHHEQDTASKEFHESKFKGWRRLLILWMFVCWNWKTEMKIIIQEWSDLTIEMKRQLPEDKSTALLGDVVGYYMEKKGWKDKHDFYPIRVHEKHIGDLKILAWVKLYNALRKRFDVPFEFIEMFQQFRYENNPLHLSFDYGVENI